MICSGGTGGATAGWGSSWPRLTVDGSVPQLVPAEVAEAFGAVSVRVVYLVE